MRRHLARISERSWRVLDRLLVVLLLVVIVVDLSSNPDREGPLALNIGVMSAIAASFLWRRSRPLVTLGCTLLGLLTMAAWLTQPPNIFAAVLALLSASYAVGRHESGRRSVAGLAAAATAVTVVAITFDPDDVFFPVTFFCIVPWLAGRTIRSQTALARELAEKAERAEHARQEHEQRAIALERLRIARELHDVLAHNLTVMVVQAAAARRVVDNNPVQAVEAARLIERTGREALAEIRHLFGPLRRGEGEDLSGPPSVARLDELARGARAAGLKVELRVLGEPVELPPGIDLAGYRIVQEALTNALKHSGGARAEVTVSYEPNELVISVEDDGTEARDGDGLSQSGGGHGIAGMRERAALYGGVVQAGRRRGGGFAVRARLPTHALVPGARLSQAPGGKVPA